jgi:hypothetical protein
MSRAYQDYSFRVAEVEGRSLSRLIGAVDKGKDERSPGVVFAEFDGADVWHRFFLQAQIAFWETWEGGSIECAFDELREDDFRLIDYSERVGGLPQRLISAEAFENADALTHLRLVLESGARMTLVPDSADIDGDFHVEFG